MANNPVPKNQPSLLDYERLGANGCLANATLLRQIAQAFNHACGMRRRIVGGFVTSAISGHGFAYPSPTTPTWGRFRTTPATSQLLMHIGIMRTGGWVGTFQPQVWLELNGTDQEKLVGGGGTTETGIDYMSHRTQLIPVSGDTDYEWRIEGQDGCKIAYVVLAEAQSEYIDTSDAGMVDTAPFVIGGDVQDAAATDLILANNSLVKRHSSHLLHSWVRRPNDIPITSATYVSVFQDASGVCLPYIRWENMNTRSRNLDVVWATNAKLSTAATMSIRVKTSTGTVIGDITTHSTSQDWQTVAGTIDCVTLDPGAYVDIEAKVSTGTLTIYGWSLYCYDA